MTIQPSVTIWTIICFVALMLILDRLLFRPLLGFMDQRKQKIEQARTEKAALTAQREEELRLCEETRISEEKRVLQAAADELDVLTQDYETRLAEKRADNARRLAEQRQALTAESAEMLTVLKEHVAPVSSSFIDSIESWRDWNGPRSAEEETAAPYLETGPAKLSFLENDV